MIYRRLCVAGYYIFILHFKVKFNSNIIYSLPSICSISLLLFCPLSYPFFNSLHFLDFLIPFLSLSLILRLPYSILINFSSSPLFWFLQFSSHFFFFSASFYFYFCVLLSFPLLSPVFTLYFKPVNQFSNI